jgi:hypothetical protein
MTETKLPTIKGIELHDKISIFDYAERINKVLFVHEQFYEAEMVKAGRKLVEEQFKDSITFAKNKERYDQLKGSRDAVQSLRGGTK